MSGLMTYEQLKGIIKRMLIIDTALDYMNEHDLLSDIETKITDTIDSYKEEDVRAFAAFKMKITLGYENQREYKNKQNELFSSFMKARADDKLRLKWDETSEMYVLKVSRYPEVY